MCNVHPSVTTFSFHEKLNKVGHRKNNFAEVFKNVIRYRFENNFVESSNKIISKLKYDKQC